MTKDNKKKMVLAVLCALCCLSVTVMILTVIKTMNDAVAFTPPEFDPSAVTGIPNVPEGLGYSSIEVEIGYKVYACGNLIAKGKSVDVYFTSPETNTVWLLLRVTDESGTVLGQTGIIHPGEYVKTLTLYEAPDKEKNVKMNIIAYQPETYISMGTVGLNTKLTIGGQG
ncbi:MAG: hypothetical protein WAO54_07225 [Eubacteriales bacterium]|jgi:hypothetical protein